MNSLCPTLFAKTFFIVSAQLFITWLATHFFFLLLERGDPQLAGENPYRNKPAGESALQVVQGEADPRYRWEFSPAFFKALLFSDILIFFVLIFWGMNQSLSISFMLFSVWSILTGVELEYVLLDVEKGLGRKVIALTAVIVLGTGLIGIYSHIDFGFLSGFLFASLTILVIVGFYRIFVSISEVSQRLWAGFGVLIFTLYLVYDFNRVLKDYNAGYNDWPHATSLAIDLYLDIINLLLHLLSLFGGRHH